MNGDTEIDEVRQEPEEPSEVTILGSGVGEFAPGVVGGVFGITMHDFGDGKGIVPSCKLRFNVRALPSFDTWLTIGDSVTFADTRWEVTYVSTETGSEAVVTLKHANGRS